MPSLPAPWAALAALGLLIAARGAAAQATCATGEPVGQLVSMVGDVQVNGMPPKGELPFVPLCADDLITVGPHSRAGLYLLDADTPVRLDENTVGRIQAAGEPGSGLFDLTRGAIYFLSQVRRTLTIRTPYVNAGIEGTEVYLRVREASAEMIVLEGRVAVAPGAATAAPFAPATVATGEQADVSAAGTIVRTSLPSPGGRFGALREIAVGALSWTLFYPDVLTEADAAQYPRIAKASRLLAAGQVAEAEGALATVPVTGTEAGLAAALRAIVAVGRKDAAAAASLADQAKLLAPASPVSQLALSYARQLTQDFDAAFAAATEAANLGPDEPLPQARLAEIHLMRGEFRQARQAAEGAVQRGGGPLAQMVLGYADLAALRGARSEAAFREALKKESWNPLALLGLGLAEIKQGELDAGTLQIQNAVTHDPNSSILRSYLGNAYFEQRLNEPSARQLAIAKELDPLDPTPWFYDALRKQLDNRPVEALRDLNHSISLNNNRAPYRSQLLLQEDAATRQASVARIYQDLGFGQLGAQVAAAALDRNPASASLHRFFADTVGQQRRQELVRLSETFKAQLLEPPNNVPFSPQLAYADLRVRPFGVDLTPGFNEYSNFFNRNGSHVAGQTVVGTQSTVAGEISAATLYNNASLAVGYLNSSTDGYRRNADADNLVADILGKIALGPETTIQFQLRHRDSEQGILATNFDGEEYDPDTRRNFNQDIASVGLVHRPSPRSTLLLSSIVGRARNQFRLFENEDEGRSRFRNIYDGSQNEAQYVFRGDEFTVTGGGLLFLVDRETSSTFNSVDRDENASAGYLRVNWFPVSKIDILAGMGIDRADVGQETEVRWSPLLGVRYQLTDNVMFRAAYFQNFRHRMIVDQTLRPSQVVGFTETFDDYFLTDAKTFGAGVDVQVSREIWLGAQAAERRINPFGNASDGYFSSGYRQRLASGYINWTPARNIALSFNPAFSSFKLSNEALSGFPDSLDTIELPAEARYFDESGLTVGARFALFHQSIQQGVDSADVGRHQSTTTPTVDLFLTYPEPSSRIRASLEVLNLFDANFQYEDDNFLTFEDRASGRASERTIIARIAVKL